MMDKSHTKEALSGINKGYKDDDATLGSNISQSSRDIIKQYHPFHWILAFPEVFLEKGGFDAIVGNPPFLGGQKISTFFGEQYRNFLLNNYVLEANNKKGSSDIVAYFFLRAFNMLRTKGMFGLIATNSIAEGATRETSLFQIIKNGGTIFSAFPNTPWEGNASVVTSQVFIIKSLKYEGRFFLKKNIVDTIDTFLTSEGSFNPNKLNENAFKSFQGSNILGKGFYISEKDFFDLISLSKKNSDVLFPVLNGTDLNNTPEQFAKKYVISFFDWDIDEVEKYQDIFTIIKNKVEPERRKQPDSPVGNRRRKLFWRYAETSANLYHALGRWKQFKKHSKFLYPNKPLSNMFVFTLNSKYWMVSVIDNIYIPTHSLGVFAFENFSYFSLLQSELHHIWARKNSSSIGQGLRYTPSDVLETFPFPNILPVNEKKLDINNPIVAKLEDIGKKFHNYRKSCIVNLNIGLTNLYNSYHRPTEMHEIFIKLRKMSQDIDKVILEAYGWNDINLAHDFYSVPYLPENDCIRFTISESARLEILKRLFNLNEEQYKEEVESGLWDKKKIAAKKKIKSNDSQGRLF